jgi:predicted transcriptional regulator
MAKRAKGSKQWRVTQAIHYYFTTNMTMAEIGDELGVSKATVHNYVHEPPAEEVQQQLDNQATQVRLMAFEELRRHLREAGARSRTATKPVKVYENDDGELEVEDIELEGGQVKKIPVVQDIELLPDREARFYARKEIREALEMLIDLVGAGEPDQLELSGEVDTGADLEELAEMAEDLF